MGALVHFAGMKCSSPLAVFAFSVFTFPMVMAFCACDARPIPEQSVAAIQPPVSVKVAPLRSSQAANSSKGSWRITSNKNPITAETTTFVEQRSKKAMYNKYSSDGFEKVTLNIQCSAGSAPALTLSTDGVLDSDSDSHYVGDAKIDDKRLVARWYVKSGIMVADVDDIVARLQTGKTFMMSYRMYEGGTQFPEFDLTGLRYTMNKAKCPTLDQ